MRRRSQRFPEVWMLEACVAVWERAPKPKNCSSQQRTTFPSGLFVIVRRKNSLHPTYLSMWEGENLGRVSEWDWSLPRRVEGVKQVNKEGDQTKVGAAALWDPETEACGKEGPAHIWEGEKEETSTSKGVNCPDSGPGKNEIDESESPRGQKSFGDACSSLSKNGGGIESNNVNWGCMSAFAKSQMSCRILLTATHLLSNHSNTRSLSSTPYARNGDQLNETSEKVPIRWKTRLLYQYLFLLEKSMSVIKITGRLNGRISEPQERPVGLRNPTFLHKPPWRLWTEENPYDEGDSRNKSRSQLQTPGNFTDILFTKRPLARSHSGIKHIYGLPSLQDWHKSPWRYRKQSILAMTWPNLHEYSEVNSRQNRRGLLLLWGPSRFRVEFYKPQVGPSAVMLPSQ